MLLLQEGWAYQEGVPEAAEAVGGAIAGRKRAEEPDERGKQFQQRKAVPASPVQLELSKSIEQPILSLIGC